MSQVSNVILTFSAAEPPAKIEEVNLYFRDQGYERGLVSIEDNRLPPGWYGGNKPFEAELLIGAFNFLNTGLFVEHLKGITWEQPAFLDIRARAVGRNVPHLHPDQRMQ